MARADYQAQMERHVGERDVLPRGLLVPSLPHGTDWQPGSCRGIALLTDDVLEGNRWPAVSGAVLAELAHRCATLAALTITPPSRWPRRRELSVSFRKAIPVADPRGHPQVADGLSVLYWNAKAAQHGDELRVEVRMTRQPDPTSAPAVEAALRFEAVAADGAPGSIERRMSDYRLGLPRRLALPAYLPGWTAAEIRGVCRERPGSLLAVAEQALGDAGKIIRGDGTPDGEEESMLLAAMTYRWLDDVDDACAEYVARPGERRRDEKGRDWVDATATLSVDGKPVGEAGGSLVFRRYRPSA